jgi:DNA-binding response OmpR family regulator
MSRHRQTILAITDDEGTKKAIREGMPPSRFSIKFHDTLNDGSRAYLKDKPDFVLMSLDARSRTGLETLAQICEADPDARIIVLSGNGNNTFVLECIRNGASDYLPKPLKPKDLQRSIDRITTRSMLIRKSYEPDRACVQEERKTLVFGNDLEALPYIINQAVTNASVVCPDVPMLKMALGEILLNAIEHGNLGITMKEKSVAMSKNAYPDLIRKRREDPRNAGKKVTLHIHMTRDRLTYRVIDQGEGFDHKSLLKRDPHVMVGSGLGLFVAKNFFSRLSFHGTGNEVVLVYRHPISGR